MFIRQQKQTQTMRTPPPYFLVKTILFAFFFTLACQKEDAPPPPAATLPDLSRAGERLAEIKFFTQNKDWAAAWPMALSLADDFLAHPNFPQDSLIGQLDACFFSIGDGFYLDKKFDRSIQVFEKSLKLVEKRPDLFPIKIAANKMHLAIELHELGQTREAIALCQSATDLFEQQKSPITDSLLGWSFIKTGSFYLSEGDYREAIRFYEKSLNLTSGLKNWTSMQSYSLCDLAICHAGLGNLDRANEYMHAGIQRVKLAKPAFAQYYQGFLTDQFGALLLDAGKAREALGLFESQRKSWEKDTQNVAPSDWAALNESIGRAHFELGETEKSLAALDESLRLWTTVFPGKSPEKARVLSKKAEILSKKGDMAAALPLVVSAISAFEQTGEGQFSKQLFEIFAQKAEIEAQLFEYEKKSPELLRQSVASFEKASELLDGLRENFADSRSKTELMAGAGQFYESAIGATDALARAENDPIWWEKAFFFAEKSKSVQLLTVSRETQAQELAGIPENVRTADRNLKLKLAGWQNALEQAQSQGMNEQSPDFKAARDSVFSLKNEQRKLLATIEKQFPNYFKNKMDVRVASVADVRKAVSATKNTMLVEWFWGEKMAYLFKIDSKNGVFCSKTSVDSVLKNSVDRVLAILRTHPDQAPTNQLPEFSENAHRLFQRLLAPVFEGEKLPENLVLVPDGILGRLPFEVLLSEKSGVSWRSLPYLMQSSTVGYAFSATLFLEKKPATRAEKAMAAFAPDYASTGLLADNGRGKQPELTIFPGMRNGFQALKNNQPEAATVAEIARGTAFLGKDATETGFKQVAGQFRALHFAMHALANDSLPELSQLVFSENGDDENDGRLYAWELCGLPLNAELVTLSACETGVGRVQRGEGVQSLARAFRQAGCPNLVMSLWQADDLATGQIMEKLYQKRAENTPQTAALASAKRVFLTKTEDNRLTHPFFWATFVRVGSIENTGLATFFPTIILAALAILAALFYWYLKTRVRVERA